jgi:hypothetical protein
MGAGGSPERLRLFFHKSRTAAQELQDATWIGSVLDCDVLHLRIRPAPPPRSAPGSVELYGTLPCGPDERQLVSLVRAGIYSGLKPVRYDLDGSSSGTYFLRDKQHGKVACFKPEDEEPGAVRNPHGYVGILAQARGVLRPGILPGDSAVREVAAYLLDKGGRWR